jgi:hypothetical protein
VIRGIVATIEIVILSVLILATRCANYQDVLVAGNVYFSDADCYARMTRVGLVSAKPGLIVRHHDFENFSQGTTPHTTAPLDYLILGLSHLLKPFTTQPLDLAGAFISPLLALFGGWFLWWWSRQMMFRHRWVALILFAISPILVHGTELGRPDHQSLLMLLMTIAICAEWSLQNLETACTPNDDGGESRKRWQGRIWGGVGAVGWAMAIWVSAYEPVVLFLIVIGTTFVVNRRELLGPDRRRGWILFAAIIVIVLLIERRIPPFAIFESNAVFNNWARTVGELAHVSPTSPVWLRWCGYFLLLTPFLIWMRMSRNSRRSEQAMPWFVPVLLVASYALTIWQARWGYFFLLIFALALPALLAPIKSRTAVWIASVLSMYPLLRDWDERLWPNEAELARRVEQRIESVQIRDLALSLRSSDVRPFLAPWWLSPSIAYWSGQPGVTGSSHESLDGIEDSARFYLSEDLQKARKILQNHRVAWVFAYDSERVAQNSAAILNESPPLHPLCGVLDRTPSQAPPFLIFSAQNVACKLYGVAIE